MMYIIFDLETVVVRQAGAIQHIIEIGAVRVEERNGKIYIKDSFQTYVNPPYRWLLDKKTLEFTGLSKDNFKNAPRLKNAVNMLKKWIGKEEYYLCAWSDSDLWILAINSVRQEFDLSWVKNFNDIQPLVGIDLTGEKKQLSLESALEIKNGKLENEQFHSALLDSISTATLFTNSYDILKDCLKTDSNPFARISSSLFRTCSQCNSLKKYYYFRAYKKGGRTSRCSECRTKNYREKKKRCLSEQNNLKSS